MTVLKAIWELSLLLAGTALMIMCGLIAARLLLDRRNRRRELQRRLLVPALLGAGDLEPRQAKTIAPEVVAEVSLHLIHMVRGADRDAFVERATRLAVPRRLARLLQSGSPRTRLAAAQAMSAFPDEESLAALRSALQDSNHDVRLAAALSIAEVEDARSATAIVSEIGGDQRDASLLTVTLLKRIAAKHPEQVQALVTSPAVHARVRIAALEALVSIGDYALVSTVAKLALSAPDDAQELPHYYRALGRLAHPQGRDAILNGLSRPSMAARAAAAGAAGKIGIRDAAGPLSGLLDDAEWWVRFRAAEALVALGTEGHRLLDAAVCLGSPRAQEAARIMLAEKGLAS